MRRSCGSTELPTPRYGSKFPSGLGSRLLYPYHRLGKRRWIRRKYRYRSLAFILFCLTRRSICLVRMECPAWCSGGRRPLIAGRASLQRLGRDFPRGVRSGAAKVRQARRGRGPNRSGARASGVCLARDRNVRTGS